MRRRFNRVLRWAAVVTSVSLGGAFVGAIGPASASTPGVTSSQILFGSHQPLTGPAAPGYSEIAPAIQAFFNYVDSKGGIYKRKVKLMYENDQYNPALTTQVVQKQVLQDNVFGELAGLGTPTHEAVVKFLNQNKVPDLFVASGCDCWNEPKLHPYTFGYQPDYIIEGKILGTYIKSHFKDQKVGVIYQNDDFGGGGLKGLKMELPSSQIVVSQPYDPATLTNGLGTQVAALKAAGAQVVVSFTIPAALALELLAQATIGYQPSALLTSSVSADPGTLAGLLSAFSKGKVTGNTLTNGIYTLGYLPSPSDTSDPWIKLFDQIHAKYDQSQPIDGNMVFGMSLGYTTYLTLKAAGKNLTRQGLINALEKNAKNFRGPFLSKFGFSKSSHLGFLGERVAQLNNGAVGYVSPMYVTTPSPKAKVKVAKTVETGVPKALK
ncbi:MAG: ABC transporter substrate-binding protein [Acidimicrobiales bacterium]